MNDEGFLALKAQMEQQRQVFDLGALGIKALLLMNGLGFALAQAATAPTGAFLAGLIFAMLTLTVSYLLAQLMGTVTVQRLAPARILAVQIGPAILSFVAFLGGAATLS
jgi:uncharacterized membrane protein YcfT